MNDISLINGRIVAESINKIQSQDYIEIELADKRVVIITATANGCLKRGLKWDRK